MSELKPWCFTPSQEHFTYMEAVRLVNHHDFSYHTGPVVSSPSSISTSISSASTIQELYFCLPSKNWQSPYH